MSKKTVKVQPQEKLSASRRSFLKTAAVGAAGARSPRCRRIHVAQTPITLRFQSTWPTKDIFTSTPRLRQEGERDDGGG